MVKITTTLLCALAFTTAAACQESKVHALFVVDTNSNVGQFVQIDKHNALRSIHGGFRDANQLHRLSYTVLEGQNATPQNVIQHLRGLQPGPEDTIFFYYAGHGANEQGKGHFLRMSAGRLNRATLKQEIDRHNVRLKIILTESCSNLVPPMHTSMKPGVATGNWDTLSQLFFSGSGTVDVNSCRPGQVARAQSGTGALFTHCLSDVLCSAPQGPVSWQSLLGEVNSRLERFVPRQSQTPCVYYLVESNAQPTSGQQFAAITPEFTPTQPHPTPLQQRPMPMQQSMPMQQQPMPTSTPEFTPTQHQLVPPTRPQFVMPQQAPMSVPPVEPADNRQEGNRVIRIVCVYPAPMNSEQ